MHTLLPAHLAIAFTAIIAVVEFVVAADLLLDAWTSHAPARGRWRYVEEARPHLVSALLAASVVAWARAFVGVVS
jgi:hypothetical protein